MLIKTVGTNVLISGVSLPNTFWKNLSKLRSRLINARRLLAGTTLFFGLVAGCPVQSLLVEAALLFLSESMFTTLVCFIWGCCGGGLEIKHDMKIETLTERHMSGRPISGCSY